MSARRNGEKMATIQIQSANVTADLFCVIMSVILITFLLKNREKGSKSFAMFVLMNVVNCVALITNILSFHFLDNPSARTFITVVLSINYIAGYVMNGMFSIYLTYYINRNQKKVTYHFSHVMMTCIVIACLGVFINLFNNMYFLIDEEGRHIRGPLFNVAQIIAVLILAADNVFVLVNLKKMELKEFLSILSFGIFPFVAFVFQAIFEGIIVVYDAAAFSFLVIFMQLYLEQKKASAEKNAEIEKNNVAVMISQLQPHFLYNSLANIKVLCKMDPEYAATSVDNFAKYLRGNLESVVEHDLVHFERELEHVKTYLELEKMRFQDKLTIEYDIQETDFFIPFLTVQLLVENSVRHGIGKLNRAGYVKVSTSRTDNEIKIVVEDNGVGFDAEKFETELRRSDSLNEYPEHTLPALIKRVKEMSNGVVEVNSRIGYGTKIVVHLPQSIDK